MKLRTYLSLAATALLSVSIAGMAQTPAPPTGKIHGHVTDPTGVPKGPGTIGLSTDLGHTMKYTFPVSATGDFSGDGIAPGTYSVIFRLPETPEGKFVDEIDNVKIVASEDVKQDVDMSRQAYIDKMTPEQKKQVEEFKKKNADIMKTNGVIKTLNADLADARAANHDKKYDQAETLMLKDTALKPDGELLWYELGIAQLGLKKYDDASNDMKKTLDLANADKKPIPELIGGAHAAIGEIFARTAKPDDAAAAYEEAVKANPPKTAFYYYNEAVVFSQVGNTEAQGIAADKAITADPKNPIPYYLKGQALIPKATEDPKTHKIVLPPGCAEAYEKYLDLAPTGQFANDVKEILAQSNQTIESKYRVKK
jgi:tetratricopeptide (TPR) repeat protein